MADAYWSFERIFRQAAPFLVLSGIGELLAGIILKNYLDYIELVPGILVLLPALMNLRGATQSALASRLGSAYHLGLIKGKSGLRNDTIQQNLIAALALAVLASVASAVFSYFVCVMFGLKHISLLSFMVIAVSASLIGALVLGFVTVYLTTYAIRRRLDPDNMTIPTLTTFGDIFMVLLVFVIIVLFAGGV